MNYKSYLQLYSKLKNKINIVFDENAFFLLSLVGHFEKTTIDELSKHVEFPEKNLYEVIELLKKEGFINIEDNQISIASQGQEVLEGFGLWEKGGAMFNDNKLKNNLEGGNMPIELKEEKYKQKLKRIKEIINQIQNQSRSCIVPYSPHDTSHSEKLEALLDNFFPDKEIDTVNKVFNDKEKFLLLGAIWLHDVGMYPQLCPNDPNPNSLSRDELEEWEREVLRKTHHERSEKYILENWENLNLENGEAQDLALICKYHRKSQNMPAYTDEKVRLIIAYLRLLDALHIPDRPSKDKLSQLRTYLAYKMDPISKSHWYKSFYVAGVELLPDELELSIKFILPERWSKNNGKEKMSPLVRTIMTDIRDELDAVKDILVKSKVKYSLPAYMRVTYDFKLTPLLPKEIDELESLLAIIELFDPTIAPNSSELINIVLDGIERCVDINKLDSSIETLNAYQRDILKPLLKCRPCHVYLWKVHDYLDNILQQLSVMTSFSQKEGPLREFQITIMALKEKRKELKVELPRVVLNELGINIDDVILVYGYSTSVVAVFCALRDEIKEKIEVIVCECSTKSKHRYDNKLIYCDGIRYLRGIKESGIKKVYYTPDLCASNLFSNGKFHIEGAKESKKITKVFFGANGVDIGTGEVAHGLGHLAIADIASIYKIPVYVITESMKIGKLRRDPKNQRREPWYPTDILFDEVNEFNSYNPREDIVPQEKITGILTEKGSTPLKKLDAISSNISEISSAYKRYKNI
jgi:translation initiation factor 2B subunit (eIF-2B alpha/beta/delta family)/predicted transcriptional regulator